MDLLLDLASSLLKLCVSYLMGDFWLSVKVKGGRVAVELYHCHSKVCASQPRRRGGGVSVFVVDLSLGLRAV